ncbi:class A beta-lactamase-related serine hydrolase [Lactobacillus helveticus]|uniref:serine hydrolase domain-containing protein n=1 Tax=Lactobacillus helveticus TaxID=1587 RepID=UPI001C64757A|nr:serine hydrolase domain-containing protein [Lactobacillus helveticus]MBW8013902.1 class A beta-lactamase-related serine hydrolase [Lactobacillus helveticus]
MRQAINRLGIKGSVLVTSNRKPLLEYVTNNSTDTSYLINSVQKSMTAAMVMREVQKGKLKLDDPLSKFYPNVDGADNVKISNLLTMTSGLDLETDQQLGTPKFISDEANIAHDAKYTVFDGRKLGKWHYTAVNYIYLCGILSKLEHKSYEKLFRETYIKPLKLKQTEFLWSRMAKLKSAGWVPGYERSSGQFMRVDHDQAVKDAHNELGAGSIVMSNADLAKTIEYILHGKLLTKESRKVLFKGKAPSYYNGGFYNLKKYKAANGAGEGYYTFLRTTKGAKDMIIIQDNHTAHGEFGKIKKKVNRIMSIMLHFN